MAEKAAGYKVVVHRYFNAPNQTVAIKHAPYGDFVEIGYWLDENGYNTPDYFVTITFDPDED